MGFKIRVRGRLSDGEIVYNRVPASTVEQKPEPVGNFNKPNGGLMSMLWEPTPKGVASKEMTSDVLNFIHNEVDGLKPKMLFMKSLKWKYLIRNILRGKNIMMTGPAGCGKTMKSSGYSLKVTTPSLLTWVQLKTREQPLSEILSSILRREQCSTLHHL